MGLLCRLSHQQFHLDQEQLYDLAVEALMLFERSSTAVLEMHAEVKCALIFSGWLVWEWETVDGLTLDLTWLSRVLGCLSDKLDSRSALRSAEANHGWADHRGSHLCWIRLNRGKAYAVFLAQLMKRHLCGLPWDLVASWQIDLIGKTTWRE
jgi:hypothetical protein